jgi:RNA polymerase sigma-70 factor (ECF subfamily)
MPMEDAPDDVLIAGLAAGDEGAARVFVGRFSSRAIGLAYQLLGDRAAAEDVAQEALVRAWRHAGTYDARRGSASAWMLTIVRNLAIDTLRLRRAQPFDPMNLPIGRLSDDEPAAEDEAARHDDASRLRVALGTLPLEQRRSLIMAYAGYTALEVAAIEQIPIGTAKTRIRAGLQKLRVAYLGAVPEEVAP